MYYIIGAGIWGLTMARLIVENLGQPVTIIERREHLGGNSQSYFDAETGIECHQYGSHIFHTSIPEVWQFVTRFGGFTNYCHKVLARHGGRTYAIPINLLTINALYGSDLSPEEARAFIASEAAAYVRENPANIEEKALGQIGRPLYEAFIRHYTAKQWNHDPKDLPASIISRLPVRFSCDINYFGDPWQGVPHEGYCRLFERMAEHPLINIKLNCDFLAIREQIPSEAKIIYTGLPDELFGCKYGPLEWRSLEFRQEALAIQDFQGTTVMNYTDADVSFTRIHEFKHYNPERREVFESGKTIICREYPKNWRPGDEAYYPVMSRENLERYELYAVEARKAGIILGGRLGRYKYLDMDKAIADAMQIFDAEIAAT